MDLGLVAADSAPEAGAPQRGPSVRAGGRSSRQGELVVRGVSVDLVDLLVRAEHERTPGSAARDGVDRQAGLARGPTDVEGRMRPQRPTDRLIVVAATTWSPARALRSRSVVVSAMPRRTTVVPKSERNPSAAPPQRAAGLGEVLQAGQHQEALPGALADHGRQVGDRGDVGHLVEGEQGGRAAAPRRGHVRRWRRGRRRRPPTTSGANWRCRRPGRADVEGVRAASRTRRGRVAACASTPVAASVR